MPKRTQLANPYGTKPIYAPLPIEQRIELAKRALASQQPPRDQYLECQMRELIENLCYLAWDREDDGVEVDSLLIGMVEWHYQGKADPDETIDVRVVVRDAASKKQGGKARDVFISYGLEDAELAECLGDVWPKSVALGRSTFDDAVTRRMIDSVLAEGKIAVVRASPSSLDDEPSLVHLLKTAKRRGVPVVVVSRSDANAWVKPLRAKGVLSGKEGWGRSFDHFSYRSGPLQTMVRWIDTNASHVRPALAGSDA